MATEDAKAKLDRILRDWSLMDGADETLAKARSASLPLVQNWLQSGAESPAVVIRAVQTLLADPERPGMDARRTAIEETIQPISKEWNSAGAGKPGMLGLQALLLAAWPPEMTGWLTLAPLLDSAWLAMRQADRRMKRIEPWRQDVLRPVSIDHAVIARDQKESEEAQPLELASVQTQAWKVHIESFFTRQIGTAPTAEVMAGFETYESDLQTLANRLSPCADKNALSQLANLIQDLMRRATLNSEHHLLWWGQARYSQTVGKPYRRIKDSNERLWWMAAEASALVEHVDVTSAASFLMETLHQVDGDIETKRPLKDWMVGLLKTLRSLLEVDQYRDASAMKLSLQLEGLAKQDALGLPVTWVHLEALNPRSRDENFEERAKEAVGLDLDTEIDRGEWAAWIFRESLLDRRLHKGK